jgi:hypothetical protein
MPTSKFNLKQSVFSHNISEESFYDGSVRHSEECEIIDTRKKTKIFDEELGNPEY